MNTEHPNCSPELSETLIHDDAGVDDGGVAVDDDDSGAAVDDVDDEPRVSRTRPDITHYEA
jgi:hypothetical protein